MRPVAWFIAAITLFGLTGCESQNAKPSATPNVTTAAPTTSAAPTGPSAEIVAACHLVDAAIGHEDTLDAGTVNQVSAAVTASNNADLRIAGLMFRDRYELARAAAGQDDEATMQIQLTTATVNLSTACLKAGVPTG